MKTIMRYLIAVSMCLLLPVITMTAQPFMHVSFNVYDQPIWVQFVGVHNDSDADFIVSGYGAGRYATYHDTYVPALSSVTFTWPAVVSKENPGAYLLVAKAPKRFWDMFTQDCATIRPHLDERLVYVRQQYRWNTEYDDYSFYPGTSFWIVIHSDYFVELAYE